MKRIFPIITILILLSLLGIIFFQVLWIKGALASERQKFKEHIMIATVQASTDLMTEKGTLMSMTKKAGSIFPSERLQMEYFRPTITQRYSRDEITEIIRKAFNKQNLKNIPFEFAITSTSLIGDEIQ